MVMHISGEGANGERASTVTHNGTGHRASDAGYDLVGGRHSY
jgi:hypothetical protein